MTDQSDAQFERDVLAAFAFIAVAEPRIVRREYSAESFGNAVLELEGDELRIRVTRDRGQLLVDLAPRTHGDWFDEAVVLQLVEAEELARELAAGEWREVLPAAKAIRSRLVDIIRRFDGRNWVQTRSELKSLQERRARELFGWPGPARRHRDPAV